MRKQARNTTALILTLTMLISLFTGFSGISVNAEPDEVIWNLYAHRNDGTTTFSPADVKEGWNSTYETTNIYHHIAGKPYQERYYVLTGFIPMSITSQVTLPSAGTYVLSVYVPHTAGTAVGKITVKENGQEDYVYSNIQTNGVAQGTWVDLPEHTYTTTTPTFVFENASLDKTGSNFRIDTIKLTKTGEAPEASPEVSPAPVEEVWTLSEHAADGTTVFTPSEFKTWEQANTNIYESNGGKPYKDIYYALSGYTAGMSISTKMTLKEAGTYALSVYVPHSGGTTVGKITVKEDGQEDYVYSNVATNGVAQGTWVDLPEHTYKTTTPTFVFENDSVGAGGSTFRVDTIKLTKKDSPQASISPSPEQSASPSPKPETSPSASTDPGQITSVVEIHAGYPEWDEGLEIFPADIAGSENEGWNPEEGWVPSGSLTSSRGSTLYTNKAGAWAKYTPKLEPHLAGLYKVSFYNVFVSGIGMDIVIHSNGQDQQPQNQIPTNISFDQIGWVELGTYSFNCQGDEYVKLTANGSPFARASAIRFELVEAVPQKPLAENAVIAGSFAAGEKIALRYDYTDYNNDKETGSQCQLYFAESESGPWTASGAAVDCSADAETILTIPSELAGKYVRVGVVPKNAAEEEAVGTESFSNAVGPVAASQAAPEVRDVTIEGEVGVMSVVTGKYTYYDEAFDLETESVFQYYYADSADSASWEPAAGGRGVCNAESGAQYRIPSELMGKYIKVGITPKCGSETLNTGTEVLSEPVGPVGVSTEKGAVTALNYGGQVVQAAGWQGAAIDGKMEVDSYTYIHPYGIEENAEQAVFQWYVGDTSTGTFTKIDGATGRSYTPQASQAGKYIRVGVKPVSMNGAVGDEFMATPLLVRYQLSFFDEFDYDAENGFDPEMLKKWRSDEWQLRSIPGSLDGKDYTWNAIRGPENVDTKDGKLRIHNRHETLPQYAGEHEWTTGHIGTRDTFTYGYYETMMKMAPARGINQSFWMMSPESGGDEWAGHIELDFIEGHYNYNICTNLMRPNTVGTTISSSIKHNADHLARLGISDMTTLAQDFFKIGGIFQPNDPNYDWDDEQHNGDRFQVFFNDKTLRKTISTPVDPNPGQIFLSCAIIGSTFSGPLDRNPDGSFVADDTMIEYEYVRFYDFIDTSSTELGGLIEQAKGLLNEVKTGNEFGQVPSSSASALSTAISSAERVYNNGSSSQEEREGQLNALKSAVNTFNRSIITKGTAKSGVTYDLTKSYYTGQIELTIPADVIPANIILPSVASNTIVMKDSAVLQNGKTVTATLTIPIKTQINGSYQKLQAIPNESDSYDTLYALKTPSWSFLVNLGKYELNTLYGGELSLLVNGQLVDIPKITVNSQNAATAAIGENQAVVYLDGGKAVLYARSLDFTPIAHKQKEAPTPTPTPDTGNNNNNNNNGYYPGVPGGGTVVIPPSSNTNKVKFTDINGHWAYDQIAALTKDGTIKGITETEFAPEQNISRAQFAALIRRALNMNTTSYQGNFSDIFEGDWYVQEISAITASGIMNGDVDGRFRPNDPITREEMAKVIVQAYKYKNNISELPRAGVSYNDSNDISGWAQEYVQNAVALGLMNGIGEGNFAPKANSTRAQGAVVIYRLTK